LQRWEGPFVIDEVLKNGSYQLMDLSRCLHATATNGWRLKLYFTRFGQVWQVTGHDDTLEQDPILDMGQEDEDEASKA